MNPQKVTDILKQSGKPQDEQPKKTLEIYRKESFLAKIVDEKTKELVLRKYPTQLEFMNFFNHQNMIVRYEKFSSVSKAYESGMLKLYEVGQIYKPETPVFLIESWINQTATFLGSGFLTAQVKELAFLIYSEYNQYNLAEISLMFKRIKTGYYEVITPNGNPAQYLSICRQYKKERGNYISKL